jgi:methionyl-tRNA formyltransferase
MKICIFGNKSSTSELISYLFEKGFLIHTLICVNENVSKKNIISGHDKNLPFLADKFGIEVVEISDYSLSSKTNQNFFKKRNFDLGLSTGWQRIIPGEILSQFKYGVFGWHGSGFNLPNGRGRSPLNWSIRLGLKSVYHNCFRYGVSADDGDLFDIKKIKINQGDHIKDIQFKALQHIKKSSIMLIKNIIDDKLKLKKQPRLPFIIFPKLDESSGHIDPFCLSAFDAMNIVRSCSKPFPGAFIRVNEFKSLIRIWNAEVKKISLSKSEVGKIEVYKDFILVNFFDGFLKLTSFDTEPNVLNFKKYKKLTAQIEV